MGNRGRNLGLAGTRISGRDTWALWLAHVTHLAAHRHESVSRVCDGKL